MTLTPETLLPYHAGDLSPDAAARIEAQLAADPQAQALLAAWQAQDAALAALYRPIADEPVPMRLTAVLQRAEAQGRPTAPRPAAPWRGRVALAAVLMLGIGLGGGLGWGLRGALPAATPGADPALAALAAHDTFAVEVVHPVEVPASDAAHLTAWLSKRLGHPIHAPDFAASGFRLMGGRVVPAEGGTAALFLYEDAAGQRITLYVAPEGSPRETAFRFVERGATQGFWWTDAALSYAVIGTLPRDQLRLIAVEAYRQLI